MKNKIAWVTIKQVQGVWVALDGKCPVDKNYYLTEAEATKAAHQHIKRVNDLITFVTDGRVYR